jgi:hypothetical protein
MAVSSENAQCRLHLPRLFIQRAIHGAELRPIARIGMPGCGWDAGLFRFLVLASGFVLLGKPGPGLRHFDQQSFVGLVRGLAGQAQAFGRAPLVVLEFGHGTLTGAQTNAAGTKYLWSHYPGDVRRWIAWHGGLRSETIYLGGRELAAMFQTCR